jgi:hypothetical protein
VKRLLEAPWSTFLPGDEVEQTSYKTMSESGTDTATLPEMHEWVVTTEHPHVE